MALEVYKMIAQINQVLDRNEINPNEEMISLYELKGLLEKEMGKFSLGHKEVELLNVLNKGFCKRVKAGAAKIKQVNFHGDACAESSIVLSLQREGNLSFFYNEDDSVYLDASKVDKYHKKTVDFIKENYPFVLEEHCMNIVDACNAFELEFVTGKFYNVVLNFFKTEGSDIEFALKFDRMDKMKVDVFKPELDDSIIHIMPDFDVERILIEQESELIKRVPVMVKKLPENYGRIVNRHLRGE